MASVKIGDHWGFINDAGELIIPTEFDEVTDFIDGVSIVKRGDFYCVIDKTGEYVVPCAMDEIVILERDVLRLEKKDKMAYFDMRTKSYMWQAKGF